MKKEDPRITRTKEAIHQAFLQLLESNEYDDITVQHILDLAQINRSTFYKYYLNKDALAIAIIDKLKAETFLPLLEDRFSMAAWDFSQKATPIIREKRELIRLLWKIDSRRVSLKRHFSEVIQQKYMQVAQGKANTPNADLAFQGHLFATISLSMMEYILQSKAPIEPQYIQQNVQSVLTFFKFE